MKEHKHAEVLRAIADGKEVECRIFGHIAWHPLKMFNPIENPEMEWRVKPKPPIVVEKHICCGGEYSCYHVRNPNIRFTFDPDTKLPIKVELI